MRTVLNLILTVLVAGAVLLVTGPIIAGLTNPAAGLLIGLLLAVTIALFTWRRLTQPNRGPSPRNPRLVAAGLITLIVLFGCGVLANLAPKAPGDAAPQTAPAPAVAAAATHAAPGNADAHVGLTTIDDTPVQAAPRVDSATLNTLPVGHQPDIVGNLAADPRWYQLSSGGWIHASHLRGEPPAGMPLLDTPPTDPPAPTAQPPSPPPVPATPTPFYIVPDDVYAYAMALTDIMDLQISSMDLLAAGAAAVAQNRALLVDEVWRSDVAIAIAGLRMFNARVRALSPPSTVADIHALYLQAADHYEQAMDLMEYGLATFDAAAPAQVDTQVAAGNAALDQATRAFTAYAEASQRPPAIPSSPPPAATAPSVATQPDRALAPANATQAQVTNIVDGDTIDVTINGQTYRVRYIGMNTPETGEPFGAEATAANTALVQGQTVTLVKDVSETDRYGRLLRYVYLPDGAFVNAELVRQGYATVATFPPDVAQEAAIRAAQQEAMANSRGLWAAGPTGPIVTRAATLHQGPGAGYPVVGNLTAGAQLDLFGTNSAGDWLQLTSGLWIAASLVANVPIGLPVTATDAFLPRGNPTPVPAGAPAYTGWTRAERGIEFRSACACDQGNVYNCDDFGIGIDAQACYLKCLDETGRDVHDLDRDHDGDACEWNY